MTHEPTNTAASDADSPLDDLPPLPEPAFSDTYDDGGDVLTEDAYSDQQMIDYARAALAAAGVPELVAERDRLAERFAGRTRSWELACENVEKERARATAAEARVAELEAEVAGLTAQVEHHTAYVITHRGNLRYCNATMRDAYSDETVRADQAEARLTAAESKLAECAAVMNARESVGVAVAAGEGHDGLDGRVTVAVFDADDVPAGTILYIERWTREEIEAAKKAGADMHSLLNPDDAIAARGES